MKKIVFILITITLLATAAFAETLNWHNWRNKYSAEEMAIVLKQSMFYFKKDGRCYAAVCNETIRGDKLFSITNIPCDDNIK